MSSSSNLQVPLQVPTEILDHILEDLDVASHDDRSSLLACSYANQALGVLAQKRLFRDVAISVKIGELYTETLFYEDNDGLTTGRKLLALLNVSPHIASYIQSITVTDVVQPPGLDQPSWSPEPNSIKSDNSEFPLYIITARAQNLKKLFLSISSLDSRHCFWSLMLPKMQNFFTQLAQRLHGIGLHPIEQVPMSIFHCSVVDELEISSMHMISNVVPPSQVKLKSLNLQYRGPSLDCIGYLWLSCFDSPSSAFDITDLRTLKVSPNATFPGLEDILKLCSKSLRNLNVLGVKG